MSNTTSNETDIDINSLKESIDELVNEAIASHTIENALLNPEYKDLILQYPEAWERFNGIFTPELTKLKHIVFTINKHFQELFYENKSIKFELERARDDLSSAEKKQGKDIISFGGIKGRVIDLAKIIGMGFVILIIMIVVGFGLAKLDPAAFDKVFGVIERMVHAGDKKKALEDPNKNTTVNNNTGKELENGTK